MQKTHIALDSYIYTQIQSGDGKTLLMKQDYATGETVWCKYLNATLTYSSALNMDTDGILYINAYAQQQVDEWRLFRMDPTSVIISYQLIVHATTSGDQYGG